MGRAKKVSRYVAELGLILAVGLLLLYCQSREDDVYKGVSPGHPVFTEGMASPSGNDVTMAACDGERIYMLQNDGIMAAYGTDGQLLGTYMFYDGSVNGGFSVYCDAGRTYVFDKEYNLYMLEALALTDYIPEQSELWREMEHSKDEYISRFDSRGVWLSSDSGEILALPTPAVQAKTVALYAGTGAIIAFVIYLSVKRRRG